MRDSLVDVFIGKRKDVKDILTKRVVESLRQNLKNEGLGDLVGVSRRNVNSGNSGNFEV